MEREVDRERRREARWGKGDLLTRLHGYLVARVQPQRPMMSFTVSLIQCTSNSRSYILTTIEERVQEEPGPLLKDTVQQPSPKFRYFRMLCKRINTKREISPKWLRC